MIFVHIDVPDDFTFLLCPTFMLIYLVDCEDVCIVC